MDEIIITLGILDKIRSITGKARSGIEKGYNPFRDATGKFASATSSKITDFDLLGRIKSGVSSLKDSINNRVKNNILPVKNGFIDNIELTDKERIVLKENISNTLTAVYNSIHGINPNLKITAVESLTDWRSIKNNGLRTMDMLLGVAHEGEILLNPKVTALLAGRENKENNIIQKTLDYFSKKEGIKSLDIDSDYAKKVLIHEILHTTKREFPTPYNETGEVPMKLFNMEEEEGANEFLTQVLHTKMKYSSSKKDSLVSDFIDGKTFSYINETNRFLGEARARFPDSPREALEFIKNAHSIGYTYNGGMEKIFGDRFLTSPQNIGPQFIRPNGNVVRNSIGSAGYSPSWEEGRNNREWLINGIDLSNIKLEDLNSKDLNSKDLNYIKLEEAMNKTLDILTIIKLVDSNKYKELAELVFTSYNNYYIYINFVIKVSEGKDIESKIEPYIPEDFKKLFINI